MNQTLISWRAKTPKEAKRFIKFLIVGAMGFIVDFGTFNLVHNLFGVRELIAQTISFCMAVTSNFIWNYFWIYPEAKGSKPGQKVFQFVAVSVLGLVIGIPVFAGALLVFKNLVGQFHLESFPINLPGNLALMTRVGVLLFWNFFVNRYWTYREVK